MPHPVLSAVLAAGSLVTILGCHDDSSTPGVTETEVRLGITAPLSGPAAAWSASARGAMAWARHVNARGGIHGRRLVVDLRDDGYVPARAVANIQAFARGTFAVIAPLGTSCLAAGRETLARTGMPVVGPLANPRVLAEPPRQGLDRVFVVYPDSEADGEILGSDGLRFVARRRAAVFYQNDDYGSSALAGFRRGLEASGGHLVSAVSCDPQDRDMTLYASRLAEARPEALALFATPTLAATLVRELDRLGQRPALLGSFTLADPGVLFGLMGPLWEGAVFASHGPVAGTAEAAPLVAALLAQDPSLAGQEGFALTGARSMILAALGLERTGPTLTREAFVTALSALDGELPGGFGPPVSFAHGRRHGLNALRLARAERASEASVSILGGYREFPPLF